MQSGDCGLKLSFVTLFPRAVLQDQSGHVRQPIAIWPGNTKSHMKQQGRKLFITHYKEPGESSGTALCNDIVPPQPAFKAGWGRKQSFLFPVLRRSGDDSTTEVWRKITLFVFGYILPPKDVWIYCDCVHAGFLWADENRLQRCRNHNCKNVNSDRDKAVVVETPMMGLLVSGLV